MTKDEVLDALEDEHEKFFDVIEGMSAEALSEPGVIGDWSVKEIIFHICMWEAELVKLLWQAAQGLQPTTVHFSNRSVDEINAEWRNQMKDRPLERLMEDFINVRKQTGRRVRAFNDQDLTNLQRFPWLKDIPLWRWIAEDSFTHEAEHAAQIRAWREEKGI